ncbi:hypothetical protein M9H77_07517 [Catharanthus roseus]|uniref:Uncharacterized protein n=1 Tax=Catharanthus roseus TaxID=4058 RepID=A0ACC0BV54_CATRO|nr:hypothetical protein M9H77_07517 [Catharanthus roseus]
MIPLQLLSNIYMAICIGLSSFGMHSTKMSRNSNLSFFFFFFIFISLLFFFLVQIIRIKESTSPCSVNLSFRPSWNNLSMLIVERAQTNSYKCWNLFFCLLFPPIFALDYQED